MRIRTARRGGSEGWNRREVLGAFACVPGTAAPGFAAGVSGSDESRVAAAAAPGGRLLQSVCRWPYAATPLPQFCRRARQIGLVAIDLLHVDEWPVARDAGMRISLGYPSRRERFIETGFNDPAHHALLIRELETALPLAAQAGVPNLIAMFGNRAPHIDEAQAVRNCAAGLSKIAPLAAEVGVTICVELLNSKVDHAGYQGDHTAFGVAVVNAVNSPRVKLLYDIYHMQIMEGDVIRTLRAHIDAIGHVHTGGVPGRHDIDDTQELNYRAIASALGDLNYAGYVAHEFTPSRADPFESLAAAFQICAV